MLLKKTTFMINVLKIFRLIKLSFLLLFFNELLNLSKKQFFVAFTHQIRVLEMSFHGVPNAIFQRVVWTSFQRV